MNTELDSPSPWIIEAKAETFQADVIERSRTVPVVVDFWAAWCQPCRMLAPLLEGLAREFAGQFVLVKADTEQLQEIAGQFGVQSIPAVFGLRDGQLVDYFTGLLPEPQLRTWIERLLPTPAQKLVSEARVLLLTDAAGAEARLREAVQLDPELVAAKLGLAELLASSGDQTRQQEARAVIEELAQRGFLEPEAEKIKAALELQQEGNTSGSIEACRQELAAAPDSFPLQLALMKALAAAGEYQEALELGLALVQNDRRATGEEARVLMIDIFRLLPEDSELTTTYRRKLSAAMY